MRPATSGLGALLVIVVVGGCGPSEPDAPSNDALAECFEADYALEPTFDSPENAVADALETEASLGLLPGSVDDHERIQRTDGWVDFELRESDDNFVVWSTTQDEDGQWGMVSVSACRPDSS